MGEKYDLLVLFSGGADSVLMLKIAEWMMKKPFCVIIDYGQLHAKEINVAKEYLDSQSFDYRVVKVSNLGINSGLTGDGGKNTTEKVHEMYVPGRNTIFISIAFSIAENMGIDIIWHGADYSDRLHLFPDCYQEYFVSFNEMLKYAGPKDITVEAPLLGMTKETILTLLENTGVDMETIFSGYGDL